MPGAPAGVQIGHGRVFDRATISTTAALRLVRSKCLCCALITGSYSSAVLTVPSSARARAELHHPYHRSGRCEFPGGYVVTSRPLTVARRL